ncbi:MAG: hypothetical protein D6731_18590 [Planctomycetota bacterium]|nr:MAG: hypothetical protein D6731_18590 [Planctomycetota bacterium]
MSEERWTRAEVLHLLGVDEDFLAALEREDVVRPDPAGCYERWSVERVRVCWNLHRDLEVNLAGQDVILYLLDRLAEQRRQFQEVLRWLQRELEEARAGE